ncbi:hypothetical protein B4102_3874 [Heyndrickxia sporothermodurans]|uniref:Uncharacterized protein n=1 Tax=Heyndrickxia sporothermodurans TaxID=46224 RepID=A0A150KL14_9BACI|nr:hypothetical protein B4102_3874 [Heyndrickxia sporothermodurans]
MTFEARKKKKINLKNIVEKLQKKGINVRICKRPNFKYMGNQNA